MAIVIDASVAAAWCFPDEQADTAERVLEHLLRTDAWFRASFGTNSAMS